MGHPRFSLGQIVHHKRFDYRGVVFDVDAEFGLTEEWYEEMAKSRPPKDQPWYRVLVDGTPHETYVAERHLEIADDDSPIRHPRALKIFDAYEGGQYVIHRAWN